MSPEYEQTPIELVDLTTGNPLRHWGNGVRLDHLLTTLSVLEISADQLAIRGTTENIATGPMEDYEQTVLGTDINEDFIVINGITQSIFLSHQAQNVHFSPRDFKVIQAYAKAPNRPMPHEEAMEHAGLTDHHNLKIRIGTARKKLGSQRHLIRSNYRDGYSGILNFNPKDFFKTWQQPTI